MRALALSLLVGCAGLDRPPVPTVLLVGSEARVIDLGYPPCGTEWTDDEAELRPDDTVVTGGLVYLRQDDGSFWSRTDTEARGLRFDPKDPAQATDVYAVRNVHTPDGGQVCIDVVGMPVR